MSLLVLHQVAKAYGHICAVENATFTLEPGEVYGLLGPNGSGKTTIMRMIAGLLTPDTGVIEIADYNLSTHPVEARRAVGFVQDVPFLYRYLTGAEYLTFLAHLWQLDLKQHHIDEMLSRFDLTDRAHSLTASYSHGMRQKLAMAGTLLSNPQVLVLDEPLTGFDPPSAKLMKATLRSFADSGRAVLLSTHILEVAQNICDRVGILVKGKIVSEERHLDMTTAFEDFVITTMEQHA
ncbi:MAG: ABC transporter ATP-binding protein [Chloroflexota bacterium]